MSTWKDNITTLAVPSKTRNKVFNILDSISRSDWGECKINTKNKPTFENSTWWKVFRKKFVCSFRELSAWYTFDIHPGGKYWKTLKKDLNSTEALKTNFSFIKKAHQNIDDESPKIRHSSYNYIYKYFTYSRSVWYQNKMRWMYSKSRVRLVYGRFGIDAMYLEIEKRNLQQRKSRRSPPKI